MLCPVAQSKQRTLIVIQIIKLNPHSRYLKFTTFEHLSIGALLKKISWMILLDLLSMTKAFI